MRFAETELRQEAWDPLEWVYLLGGGIFPLLAREFAPLAERLATVAGRLEGIPAVVEAAERRSSDCPAAPSPRSTPRPPSSSWPGSPSSPSDAVGEAEAAAPSDPAVAAVLPRLRAPSIGPRTALAAFEAHLRDVVLPAAEGEGRLGADLFARKMRHTLRDAELTPARILERAEREYGAVRAEMIRLARELWPAWMPRSSTAGRRRGDRPRRPRRHRRPAPGRRGAARVVPRGARPDRGVLPRARPGRAGRRPARDPLDAGLPARLRRRDARHAGSARQGPEGVLRDHPDPGRLDARAGRELPPRGQRPDAPAAHDPRGGARPLPPGLGRQPQPVGRPVGVLERGLRRGLGRLRHPGDDGRRGTAPTTRRSCSPTGSSTCGRSRTRSSTSGSTPARRSAAR